MMNRHPALFESAATTFRGIRRFVAPFFLAFALAGSTLGCTVRAESLRSQPLNVNRTVDAARQTNHKFLIKPFEDLRGGEYAFIFPTSLIPFVNFFHIGTYNHYPEQANILQTDRGGRATVTVGALDAAMPYLLADSMRKMRFTANTTPLEEVNTKVDLREFDYVVTGALKSTRMAGHLVLVPLATLGILGVPYMFVFYDLEYEVRVAFAQNPANALMAKSYKFSDSRVVGLYYNQSAAFDMFIAGLESTLPNIVDDIANIVAANPIAAPPPPPAPPKATTKTPRGRQAPR